MQASGLKQKLWRRLPLILILLSIAAGIALFAARLPRPVTTFYVAEIRITGALDYTSSILGATVGVDEYIRLIKQARDDPMAKAVVLVFDSPGGAVSASYDLFEAVRELSERKTVVAYARSLMASGAYLAALPAERIYASPASLVGSVGVYSSVLVAERLLDKLGISVYMIKSGSMKDIGSPYREMSEEEVKVMERIVDEYFQLFKEKVIKYRGSVHPEVFTGRPFAPQEAVAAGLIDGVFDYEEALRRARELAGLPPDAPVIELKPRPRTIFDLLLEGANVRGSFALPRLLILAMWPPPEAIVLP